MRLLTFNELFRFVFARSTGNVEVTFQAGVPYVFPNVNYNSFFEHVPGKMHLISSYDGRIRPFSATAARRGDSVLLYNGSGGYGDQVLTWPIARLLDRLGLEVHVACEPGHEPIWYHLPFVKSIVSFPWEQAKLELFDHLIFLEGVVNFDEHPDQLHPVDMMLRKIGIDPRAVDSSDKCVHPVFTPGELAAARSTVVGAPGPVGLYQLATTNRLRSMSPEIAADLLSRLASDFPQIGWVATYDRFQTGPELAAAKLVVKDNVRIYSFNDMRVFMAAVSQAAVCVGPDSLLVHLAGTCGIPTVGLWGPVAPDRRVAYYKNHVPLWPKSACPIAPCFHSTREFPPFCPPTPEPRQVCAVLGAIDPNEVSSAVRQIVQPR